MRIAGEHPVTVTGAAGPLSVAGYTVTSMEQPGELVGRALVVVVDDRTAHGDEEDHSGPLVTELLAEAGFVVDGVVVVSADEIEIRNALNTAVIGGVDLVVSVGGTGVTPRDVTPEATRTILDRELLGHRRGAACLRSVGGHHRCRPVPRPGRYLRQHTGRQHRRVALCRPGRHGDAEPAGRPRHRPALQPRDLAAPLVVRRTPRAAYRLLRAPQIHREFLCYKSVNCANR